ncbi:hypothetical protein CF327_g4427 [Tilletia walkeri]|nr:hypothetical protein CF327_g4427 [Tilletia walkeri]
MSGLPTNIDGFVLFTAELERLSSPPPAYSLLELPTSSQSCLELLDPQIRSAYNAAYAHCKLAEEAGERPDWTTLYLEEYFGQDQQATAERMRAHFDRYFERVSTRTSRRTSGNVLPSNPVAQRPRTSSASLPVAGTDALHRSDGQLDSLNQSPHDPSAATANRHGRQLETACSVPTPSAGTSPGSIRRSEGSSSLEQTGPEQSGASPQNDPTTTAGFPGSTTSGGTSTGFAAANGEDRPAQTRRSTCVVSNPKTSKAFSSSKSSRSGRTQKGRLIEGSGESSSSAQNRGPTGGGAARNSAPTGPSSATNSSAETPPSSSALPAIGEKPSTPSGSVRVSTSDNSLPTLSNAARVAVCGSRTAKGIHNMWEYRGLLRWDDGLSDESLLTFEEARRERDRSDGRGPQRWPHLRERWECRVCGVLRHEPVGSTTNLTKHSKKCLVDQTA